MAKNQSEKMKRFGVFIFDPEHPRGGWGDFVAAYDYLIDATFHFCMVKKGLVQVVDFQTFRVVKRKLIWPDRRRLC